MRFYLPLLVTTLLGAGLLFGLAACGGKDFANASGDAGAGGTASAGGTAGTGGGNVSGGGNGGGTDSGGNGNGGSNGGPSTSDTGGGSDSTSDTGGGNTVSTGGGPTSGSVTGGNTGSASTSAGSVSTTGGHDAGTATGGSTGRGSVTGSSTTGSGTATGTTSTGSASSGSATGSTAATTGIRPDGGGCVANGQTYPVGAMIPSPDGCNTCSCTASGIACTARACAPDAAVDATSACDAGADPTKMYVGTPTTCMVIKYSCPSDRVPFSDKCGCGCQIKPVCTITTCLRAVNCVETCGGPVVSSSCCACVPPAFDSIQCMGDAATM